MKKELKKEEEEDLSDSGTKMQRPASKYTYLCRFQISFSIFGLRSQDTRRIQAVFHSNGRKEKKEKKKKKKEKNVRTCNHI